MLCLKLFATGYRIILAVVSVDCDSFRDKNKIKFSLWWIYGPPSAMLVFECDKCFWYFKDMKSFLQEPVILIIVNIFSCENIYIRAEEIIQLKRYSIALLLTSFFSLEVFIKPWILVSLSIDCCTVDCALITTDSNSVSRERLRLNQ